MPTPDPAEPAMPLVTCPKCAEELDVPPEFRGRDVRCAACQAVFAVPAEPPARPAADPDGDAPRASRAGGRDPGDDFDRWDDRPRRRPRRRASTAWVWLLLAGVFGAICLVCGGLIGLAVWMEYPHFEEHDSAPGRYKVEFPGKPTVASRQEDNQTWQVAEVLRKRPVPETYSVRYRDVGVKPTPAEAQKALDDACGRAVGRVPGSTEESRANLVHGGAQAVDLFVRRPDNTATAVRFVLDGRRLYAVELSGGALEPEAERLDHFRQSFQIKPAEAGKK